MAMPTSLSSTLTATCSPLYFPLYTRANSPGIPSWESISTLVIDMDLRVTSILFVSLNISLLALPLASGMPESERLSLRSALVQAVSNNAKQVDQRLTNVEDEID